MIGENPLQSEADRHLTERSAWQPRLPVVQDIVLTATAEIADVLLPAGGVLGESEGTVMNSRAARRTVRKALDPPGEAREDLWIIYEIARRMGHDWGEASAERPGTRSAQSLRVPLRRCPIPASKPSAGSSGRAGTRRIRPSCSSTRASGGPGASPRALFSPVDHDRRSTSSTTTSRSGSRPDAASTRTTPASSRATHLAAAARQVARYLTGGLGVDGPRGRRAGPRLLAARGVGRSASTHRSARSSRS